MFCHAFRAKVVLLVNGHDKGADPSKRRQESEIALARKRVARFLAQHSVRRMRR